MDSRRLMVFILLSLGLLFLWEKYVQPEQKTPVTATSSNNTAVTQPQNNNQIGNDTNTNSDQVASNGQTITVTTDLIQAQISTRGGDLQDVDLLKHGSSHNPKQPYPLLLNSNGRTFIAQTGLVANSLPNNGGLPTHTSIFTADKTNYVLQPNQDSMVVNLTTTDANGVQIIKSYTFKRNSYTIDVSYQIANNGTTDLSGVSAYWRLLRDEQEPAGETKFANTFTGPAYYTNDAKFNTLKFSKLADNDASYPENTNNGWVGFIQHYFTAVWMLNAYNSPVVCSDQVICRLNFKAVGNLASAGILTDLPTIKAHSSYNITVPLYAGPEEYSILVKTAPHLELTKDYGWVYIFATPLFWLLVKLFDLVHNWGWSIVLLTLVVKTVLYPLTRAGYIATAKMKALAPKIETLKSQYGDDKAKLQQAMMQLYRSEKVNPIGGCLPMLMQIPVFIGLYWALLSSVELRQAHFLWIPDLSNTDPYYILPIILAITMFLQTFLNPPPADPVQARIMKIMPLAFSVMFFFFPAGLVLYWLVNNVLSIAQQWYVNNHVTLRRQNRQKK